MPSVKCPKCGLVSFAGASVCKRCQQPLGVPAPASRDTSANSSDDASWESTFDSSDEQEGNTNRILYAKVIGGSLIALGLLLGIVTALTEDYSYLIVAGPSLLIGAFIVVIFTQPRYSGSWRAGVFTIRIGLTITAWGILVAYHDGFSSVKSLVPFLGIGVIVMGVVAFCKRSEAG